MGFAPPQEALQIKRAFFVQYVSLMLIMLTFIVGAFSRDPAEPDSNKEIQGKGEVLKKSQPQEQWLRSRITFSDLFVLNTEIINPEKVGALVALLRAHDLVAEIGISGNVGVERKLLEAQVLHQSLIESGVPPSAFQIYVDSRSIPILPGTSAEVRFINVGRET